MNAMTAVKATGMTKHGHVVHGVPVDWPGRTFCGVPVERLTTWWPHTPFPSSKSASQEPDCRHCLRTLRP